MLRTLVGGSTRWLPRLVALCRAREATAPLRLAVYDCLTQVLTTLATARAGLGEDTRDAIQRCCAYVHLASSCTYGIAGGY